MRINIDLNNKIGKIKDMNATGQAPMGGGVGYEAYKNFHLLSDVLVPYVRLHDVGGGFGGNRYVDIPNIFRDFDADENDPANYDFKFTDLYISELVKNGLKPYISAWYADNFDALCGNQIRSMVAQTEPDLIFITGDIKRITKEHFYER